MLNQVVLVGRLTDDLEVTTMKNGKKVTHMVLAVQRSYKNSEGIYEADFIRCSLWNAVAASTSEYCKKGDIIGLKGRLQVSSYEDADGNKKYNTEVIAEKITFLSSKSDVKEAKSDENEVE